MPFLRFARDKRGIETIALLHSSRRHGKDRPRLLYLFRTPPDLQVGRAAIDESAIRQLEESHPEIDFDWPRILQASRSLPISAGPRERRDEKPPPERRGRRRESSRRGPREAEPQGATAASPAGDDTVPEEPARRTASAAAAGLVSHVDVERFRARYSEAMARISQRVTDPARADALRVEAEALNPDAWVTPEEVARGVEAFERNEQRLREQLGRRRRSRRGGSRHKRKHGSEVPAADDSRERPATAGPPEEPEE